MPLRIVLPRGHRAGPLAAAGFLLALLIGVAVLLAQAQAESLESTERRFAERAQVSASLIQSMFTALAASAGRDLDRHYGGPREDLAAVLRHRMRESRLHYLAVVDAQGRTLAAAGRSSHVRLPARPPSDTASALSDVIEDGPSRLIQYVIPFGTGPDRRAVVQGVPLETMGAFFGDYLKRLSTSRVGLALTDRNGVVLTRDGRISLDSTSPGRMATKATVPGTRWSLRLEDDRDHVLAGLHRLRWLPWLLLAGLALAAVTGLALYARILTSIRRQHQANGALQESRDQVRNLVDALEEGVILHHADGRTELLNASASELLGLPIGEDTPAGQLLDEAGDPLAESDTPIKQALATGKPQTKVVGLQRVDGRRQWLTVRARPLLRHGERTPHAVVASFTDVSDQRELELHLLDQAQRDPLTGLWNRRRFESDLAMQLTRCRRYGDQAALLLLDLDNFKQVNDTLGHLAGDDVLRALADSLRDRLRATDTAARIGGDEFAVLLLNVDEAEARDVAQEVMSRVADFAHEHLDHSASLSLSAGIAMLDPHAGNAEDAFAAADEALYADKRRMDPPAEAVTVTAQAPDWNSERAAECERGSHRSSSLQVLLAAVQARDSYTGTHSRQVVTLARAVARRLDIDDEDMSDVESAALLHDLGKIAMPDALLRKKGPLNRHERLLMRQHPVVGAQIVSSIPELQHLAPAIRAEHERWDGTGYPDGLAADAIPVASRIAFVCDAYHAMTSDRPYRQAMSRDEAIREIARESGRQFCPDASRALLEVLGANRAEVAVGAPQAMG
jgi:diguanylate cyclase (GGDEF)-like protein/putative nucleotidyltransferase with HDIG domain/PAS domain S-box-containing protein